MRECFFPNDKLASEYRPKNTKLSLKVAQTAANAWGLHDMHGNVSEWCADWHGPYEADEQTEPMGRIDGDLLVIREALKSADEVTLRAALTATQGLHQLEFDRAPFRELARQHLASESPKVRISAMGALIRQGTSHRASNPGGS